MYRAHNPYAPGYRNMDNLGNTYGVGSDGYTKVTYRRNPGYFERIGSSACGISIGFLILIASFPVLFLNEGRAVQTAKSLDEGLGAVVSLSDANQLYDSNNNKLIHFNGKLKTSMPITDDDFGISVKAVKLKRHIEMYQWIEHEHKREYNEGDRIREETTYSYTTDWRSEVVKSGRFNVPTGHQNPGSFPMRSMNKEASPVHVGSFKLSLGLINSVNTEHTLPPSFSSKKEFFLIADKYLYNSQDNYNPKVGDLRIYFTYAGLSAYDERLGNPEEVSIIARQEGSRLSSYQTQAGDSLEMLYYGVKTAQEMFASEHSANTVLTWVLRFVGWLMMFIAFQVMMDIIRQIVSFIPIVRDIINLATTLVAFTLATSFALVTIAIGWLRYRPFVTLTILIAAAVPLYLSRKKAEQDNKNRRQ